MLGNTSSYNAGFCSNLVISAVLITQLYVGTELEIIIPPSLITGQSRNAALLKSLAGPLEPEPSYADVLVAFWAAV